MPILLTPPQGASLPPSVAAFLAAVFPTSNWCSSAAVLPSCAIPGFVVGFGGHSVLADDALLDASTRVSGGTYQVTDDLTPSVTGGFTTGLDMAPVFAVGGSPAGTIRQCYERSALLGVRWLSVYTDSAATQFDTELDVATTGRYVSDADGVARTPGASSPVCVSFVGSPQRFSVVGGVSLSGRAGRRVRHSRTARFNG